MKQKVPNLAKGWTSAPLGEIAETASGGTPRRGRKEFFGGSIPWVKSGELNDATLNASEEFLTNLGLQSSSAKVFPAGTLCIALYGATVGRLAILGKEAATNQAVCGIFVPPLIDTDYLFYFLLWQRKNLIELGKGGAQPNISQEIIRRVVVPLPPSKEQTRIASKIEELVTQLDAGVEELRKARAQLKRYRQAVLKAAVTGELTKEWREAHKDELEPASELLARILKERRAKWEAEQLAKMTATGKKPSTYDWKNKYQEPTSPDAHILPALPSGWIWSAFGQAFRVYVGATPSRQRKTYWNGHLSWASSSEVAFCRIKSTRETITELGLQNTSTDLHPAGTVLLGMIGEGKTRGQAAILDISACNSQNSAAIRVSEAGIPPEYIYYYLQGEYERTRKLGSGNNQPALNKSRVQGMTFPLPPLAEQNEIVQEVDRLLSIADTIQQSIEKELIQADRLRQSILKRAFEGKLVPQYPNDEPAELLLERIKTERAKREAENQAKMKLNRKRSAKNRPNPTERPAA